MRNLFYPAVVLICILLVLVAALALWPNSFLPELHHSVTAFLRPSSENKPSPAPPPPPAEKKNTAAKKPSVSPHSATPAEIQSAAEPVFVPLPAPTGPAQHFPFPLAEQIPPGTPLATVIGRFGRPEMKATGADKGELRERYVYVDRASGRRTFIAVVNSIVTGAQTLTQ